jgi:hypothetical protein
LAKKPEYCVQYDLLIEDIFIITCPDPLNLNKKQAIKFLGMPKGLYAYNPNVTSNKNPKNDVCHHVDMVAENHKNYTVRQFERAKVACNLYHKVGTPSANNFNHLLCLNQIKNYPVLPEDVDIAKKIFDPDMSMIKIKSKRTKLKPVHKDIVKIPKELIMKLKLCIHVMVFVCEIPFLMSINQSIK